MPRFQQKQEGGIKIVSQNSATILWHQFVFWNKIITVWSYRHTDSTFETKTAKKRDKKLNHIVTPIVFWNQISTERSYRRTNSMFENKTAKKRDLKLVRP